MVKVKYIPIDIYRITLVVVVGNFNEFVSYVRYVVGEDKEVYKDLLESLGADENDADSFEASTYWNNKTRTPIIFLPRLSTKPVDLNNCVHELGHVTRIILGNVGVITEVGNDEAFQYLQGWLMEQVYIKDGYEEFKNI